MVPSWWWPIVHNFEFRVGLAIRGLRVTRTSHWRAAATNASVGGAGASQHLVGLAMDFDGPPDQLNLLIQRARMQGLVAIDERSRAGYRPHVHVQALPAGVIPPAIFRQVSA